MMKTKTVNTRSELKVVVRTCYMIKKLFCHFSKELLGPLGKLYLRVEYSPNRNKNFWLWNSDSLRAFPSNRRLFFPSCMYTYRLQERVIHWGNPTADGHAYVRDFIEKIDGCRSMVNLFYWRTDSRSSRECVSSTANTRTGIALRIVACNSRLPGVNRLIRNSSEWHVADDIPGLLFINYILL